jgi:hypothetical protein
MPGFSEKVLREWPQLSAESWWQEGLSNMIEAVQRFGWIDQANHAIRTHIEYAPSRPDRQPSSPNAI